MSMVKIPKIRGIFWRSKIIGCCSPLDPVGERLESVVRRWATGMLWSARAIHTSRRARAAPKDSSTGSLLNKRDTFGTTHYQTMLGNPSLHPNFSEEPFLNINPNASRSAMSFYWLARSNRPKRGVPCTGTVFSGFLFFRNINAIGS